MIQLKIQVSLPRGSGQSMWRNRNRPDTHVAHHKASLLVKIINFSNLDNDKEIAFLIPDDAKDLKLLLLVVRVFHKSCQLSCLRTFTNRYATESRITH